jgi:hypothetical protein
MDSLFWKNPMPTLPACNFDRWIDEITASSTSVHHKPVDGIDTFQYPAGGGVLVSRHLTNKVALYPAGGRRAILAWVSRSLGPAAKAG